MNKNYNDVKRAAEAALKGLCTAIKVNLKDAEAEQLFLELSMSLFTTSLDFSLPFDEFTADLAHKQTEYTLQVGGTAVKYKRCIDAGEYYDNAEEI